MDGELEIIDGPDKGRKVPFADGQTLVIGRGSNSATNLSDRYTSRVHCQLEIKQGVLTLSDLGGSGGTRLNGKSVQSAQVIFPGDVITIGCTKLRVHCAGEGEDRTVNLPRTVVDSGPTLPTLPADASLLEGSVLADYEIGPVIGNGHTGVVYQACKRADKQPVALKVFHVALGSDPAAKDRFLRGARTVMNLWQN